MNGDMTPLPENTDTFVGMHYVLSAYVMKGKIEPSPFDGPRTFDAIFTARPEGCRFAVAQAVMLRRNPDPRPSTPLFNTDPAPSGPFVVWDLLDEELVRGRRRSESGLMAPPPALWMHDSEDGMVMKAMALYDAGD